MRAYPIFYLLISLIIINFGCSTSHGINSILPETGNPAGLDIKNTGSTSIPWLGGIWDFYISEDGQISYSPLRHADAAFNIVKLIDNPPFSLVVQLVEFEDLGDHTNLFFNLGITHPVPGVTSLTMFDVCGIILSSADITHPHDSTLIYPDTLKILNADGYTRWMNCPEFNMLSMPIFGYQPGKIGTPGFEPTATLNPYKYYTDGLGASDNAFDYLALNSLDRGVYSTTSTNFRNYEMQFSHSTGLKFQYAILVHWMPNVNAPDPPSIIPDDFPDEANATEPLAVSVTNDTSTMWFDPDDSSSGGNFIADLSVINWHTQPGPASMMEDYTIYLYSNAWTGGVTPDMHCIDYGTNRATFAIDIPASPVATGPMNIWISIERALETYSNTFGVTTGADDSPLTAHFQYTANVQTGSPITEWEPPTDHDPRFVFIHHSVGSGFLYTGGMWDLLEAAGFEVHDRTYGDGWVGDNTNPNHWPITFTTYYDDMISWELDEGQYYDIVAFKSCYPASAIGSDEELLEYYGYYEAVKAVTEAHPETLFIPYSTPPLVPANTDEDDAARARIFANWLTGAYDDTGNLAAYDVFNILAGDDPGSGDFNRLKYAYTDSPTNSHPNAAGSTAVAEDFTAWLVSIVWD
ncbi:hypothetical protein KAU08_04520 [bacterium]|nr:hypothetical protein [bacterium]